MKKLLLLLILSLPPAVMAETRAYLGGWSHHLISTDVNETHGIIGIEKEGYAAGQFINSYNRLSYFGGKVFKGYYGKLEYGIITGTVYGYTSCFGNNSERESVFCPLVVPYITHATDLVKPIIFLMGDAVTLSFAIEFK